MAALSPYLAGAGIGILACISFLVLDHPLGCTTAFVKLRGLIDRHLFRRRTEGLEYYRLFVPALDGQVMVVAGIAAGAAVAALLIFPSVSLPPAVPARWAAAFGPSLLFRCIVAFAGGLLLITGARWAGGCMCGHGISGACQLSVASWITLAATLLSGTIVALAVFRLAGV
jgi:uncharacterized protein